MTQILSVAEQANAVAPWWGVPVLAGTLALLGVFIAQMTAYRLERGRREREDKRRFDKEQRELYVDYLRAAQEVRRELEKSSELVEPLNKPILINFLTISDQAELLFDVELVRWVLRLRRIAELVYYRRERANFEDSDRYWSRFTEMQDLIRARLGMEMRWHREPVTWDDTNDPEDDYYTGDWDEDDRT